MSVSKPPKKRKVPEHPDVLRDVSAIFPESTFRRAGLPFRHRAIERRPMNVTDSHELEQLNRWGLALSLQESHPPPPVVNWESSAVACDYASACCYLRFKGHTPKAGDYWGVIDSCHPEGSAVKEEESTVRLGAASCTDAILTIQHFEELLPLVENLSAALPGDKRRDLCKLIDIAESIGGRAILLCSRPAEPLARQTLNCRDARSAHDETRAWVSNFRAARPEASLTQLRDESPHSRTTLDKHARDLLPKATRGPRPQKK